MESKTYQHCLTNVGKPKTTNEYPTVEDVFKRLLEADPEEGKNCLWIFKQYKQGLFRLEDVPRVNEDLETFFKNRVALPIKERSLELYNYSQLKQVIQQFQPKITQEEVAETGDDFVTLYSGEYGRLVTPLTQEASCKLGAGTKWCTAARKENMFERYNKEGPLYIWTDRQRGMKKYQFHFGKYEFQAMDELDNPIDDELLQYYRLQHPILSQLFRQKEEEMAKNPDLDPSFAYGYAKDVIKGRWPEAEPYITKSPQYAYYYATEIIKGRWPAAEPYIMKSPPFAYDYATNVIKGRWPEAEPYIMQNSQYAYEYAINFIRGRWPEAEPYIMIDPQYAYYYASNIIGGRWPEAEPYIMQNSSFANLYSREIFPLQYRDPRFAYEYAKNTIRGRWPEAEPYIMQNPQYAFRYARDILRSRWPEAEPYIRQDPTYANLYSRNIFPII